MGAPQGQGDWASMVTDYNFKTYEIKIVMYLDPTLPRSTANALIQCNRNLYRNAGGVQGAKMRLFFGPLNALHWYANSWKK